MQCHSLAFAVRAKAPANRGHQMRALYGHGEHPDADALVSAYIKERIRPGMTERQLAELSQEAIRHATLGHRFPAYEPIKNYDERVAQRLAIIREEAGREPTAAEEKKVQADEARRLHAAVAGFDLVFSPVKSAALLWALDERPNVREAIRQAHENAMKEALALIEEHAAYTRAGTGGIAQIATNGLIAAAFEHWDFRAGDPNLHTHVAVSTKVQGTDGKWRSLDARALCRMTVAASGAYSPMPGTRMVGVRRRPGPQGGHSRSAQLASPLSPLSSRVIAVLSVRHDAMGITTHWRQSGQRASRPSLSRAV